MAEKTLVPEAFGPLQGVKIVSTGTLIAQPFAAALAAEMGAEVIQVERPGVGDTGWRTVGIRLKTRDGKGETATNWVQERRNVFCVSLDLTRPRGRELFLRLLERADIWMESSKAGTYPQWGLDDASVWKVNPKLVITHVSSYGQYGDPDYIGRTSYDIVGQAFSGIMYQTGFPETPPSRAAPWTGDYMTALFTLWSSLAGLTYARSIGKGQAIDLAQYEAIHRTLGGTMVEYFQQGLVRERSGNKAQGFQPLDSFEASDGWVVLGAIGEVYDRVVRAIGLDPADPKWQKARLDIESMEGIEFDALLRGWINERTALEVVRHMNRATTSPATASCRARTWRRTRSTRRATCTSNGTDEQAGKVKGVGVVPKFSATPGKILRGAVGVGHDNDRVYGELLGLKPAEIEELRRGKLI